MALNVGTQNINLRLLNADGSTLATLVLPPPDQRGGINFKYQNTGKLYRKPNGVPVMVYNDPTSKFVPVLTLKWSVYDDTGTYFSNPNGFGTANGQTPKFDQLISVLGTYSPNQLAVQPDAGCGFFTCFVSKDIGLTPVSGLVYENVTIEFTGTVGLATMSC